MPKLCFGTGWGRNRRQVYRLTREQWSSAKGQRDMDNAWFWVALCVLPVVVESIPDFFVPDRKSLSGKELAQVDPRFAETDAVCKRLFWSWLLLSIVIFSALVVWMMEQVGPRSASLFGVVVASRGAVEAAFTLWTGVYLTWHAGWYRYIYEDTVRLRRLARTKLGLVLACAVVITLLIFLLPAG